MTSLLKKLSISIEIGVIKRYGLESAWLVSKLLTESVGSRRELVAVVFTPPTPTRQNSFVASASAVCIGHYLRSFLTDCQNFFIATFSGKFATNRALKLKFTAKFTGECRSTEEI